VCRQFRMRNCRHTFASDMIRAGMSLPALMQLMGHADIQTTLLYVQVTPQDVYLQYARAVPQHIRPLPRMSSRTVRDALRSNIP
jgi:integrase/recombinase XerD